MKAILSERNLVLVLFVMVFVVFSFAHEDSKKMEKSHLGTNLNTSTNIILIEQIPKAPLFSGIPDFKIQGQKPASVAD